MTFAAPDLLFALLLVPLAAYGYVVLEARRAKRAEPWSNPALLPNIVSRPPGPLRHLPIVLFLLGLTLLLVGFARPQTNQKSAKRGGPTVVLTFDVSGSMAANDVQPTRILAAHRIAIRLLNELPVTFQVAVITFADQVNVVVPPTLDRQRVIAGLPTRVTPRGGTALGDAVNESVAEAVEAVGAGRPGGRHPPGAVLLFSDGAQTDPGANPQDGAAHALLVGIPIDTVSVGTSNGIVTQQVQLNGGQTANQQIRVAVDPTTLQTISQVSNGTFFENPSSAQLTRVYKNLGPHVTRTLGKHELNAALAEVALVLILAGVVLSGIWFSRLA